MGLEEGVVFRGFIEVNLGLRAGLDDQRAGGVGADSLAARGWVSESVLVFVLVAVVS